MTYRTMLTDGEYSNYQEYSIIHALAKEEYEKELAEEEYQKELAFADSDNETAIT